MFDIVAFDKEIKNLLRNGEQEKAEAHMLNVRLELMSVGSLQDLEYVVSRLAHFYSTPGSENLDKAESYFLEGERILPGSNTKYQTAMFYFYVLRDSPKTVRKVDEIMPPHIVADRSSYYSALTLKGQALIRLQKVEDAGGVLEDLLALIRTDPSNLPYGDEINLLQAAISKPILAPRCRDILGLVIPRIRSEEYVEKARSLLESL